MPDNALLSRIRGEYLEMPGMRLTLEQAQRLCGVERTLCRRMLDTLVAEKFLRVESDGMYARVSDGEVSRRRSAKALLGPGSRIATAS
jgi:DNA-binding GntR family transcriptional regulator